MRPENLSHLSAFAAVARHSSFRKAGAELTLSTSAISYAIRGLEERLGVQLFHRTTRSVSLTEAGQRLLERLEPALRDVGEALEEMNNFRSTPAGTLRVNMPRVTAQLLLPGLLPRFLRAYPDIHFEAVDNDGLIDIVASGFDAGIRFHEQVPEDMIAVPIGGPQQGACVASPAYVAAHGRPLHPNDLLRYDGIRYRFPSGRLYKWEFEKGPVKLEVDVPGRVTFGDFRLSIEAAIGGLGYALVLNDQAEDLVREGKLVRVLEDWCPPYPGFQLYYPRQRRVTSALRALIEFIRADSGG